MKTLFLFSITLLFSFFWLANATIIYVSGDVSGTWSADTVIVTAEIRVPRNSTLIIEPGVKVLFQVCCKFIVDTTATLRAIGTEQDTILFDEYISGNRWHGIRFEGASNSCRLEYCHLTHGHTNGGSGYDERGGAIYCYYSDPTIQNCLIDSCWAEEYGGGIYCFNSSPDISDNTISANSTYYVGGGISCVVYSCPIITGNTIIGNSADDYGGGIYVFNCSPTIEKNYISGNSAYTGGGIFSTYLSTPIISGNTIIGNSAVNGNGGGINCYYSSPTINYNKIIENSAHLYGGGIYGYESNSVISGNIISENSSSNCGGGILLYSAPDTFQYNEISNNTASSEGGGIYFFCVGFALNKCTITSNNASSGGGIYCIRADPTLNNCILWGNTPQQIYQNQTSNVQVTYSDIQGTWPGVGNIDADPLFADPANGDYHLTWANFPIPDSTKSPCIDTGDPNPNYNDPDSTRADMGCYYFDQGFANSIKLTLTPQNPPIQIPAGGGYFTFDILIENNTGISQIFDGWINAVKPNGQIFEKVMLASSLCLLPDSVIDVEGLTQYVPAYAPAGDYLYIGNVGNYPNTIVDADTIPFTKLAGEGWPNHNLGWALLGWNDEAIAEDLHPSSLILHPCFPNPFNATTTIAFDLPVASEVSLKVYDISGREVASLVNGHLSLGKHQVEWNAEGLPSGIYFARLQAGEFMRTQKLVLMK